MRKGFAVNVIYVLALFVQISAPLSAGLMLDKTSSQSTHDVMALCPHMAMGAETPDKSHPGEQKNGQHQQSCPFCALHCHPALILPTAPTDIANVSLVQTATQTRPISTVSLTRIEIAAQPRGPPSFG